MSLLKITRAEFDAQFTKLIDFFPSKLTTIKDKAERAREIAKYADIYFEACNDLTHNEMREGVQRCLRESKFMPKPVELRKQADPAGTRGAYSDELKGKRKHWTDGPYVYLECKWCKFEDGRPGRHGVPRDEPEPWRAYRANANRHCSSCFGCGYRPDPSRAHWEKPIGRTDGGLKVFPCECTQPGYTFEIRTLGAKFDRPIAAAVRGVEVEEVTSDPVEALVDDGAGFTEADFA